MFSDIFVLVFVFVEASPALTAVISNKIDSCSVSEFACGDGACVSIDHICDGRRDCADGSDETACYLPGQVLGSSKFGQDVVLHRSRRQATCRKNQWACRDGTCISFDGKCDGAVDCPDGSDETFPLCRKTQCQFNWFRCAYGACADGTAPCNGIQECADNSDELLPRCRNETNVIRGQFKCQNGQLIPVVSQCDGIPDCTDGSDETLRACADTTCLQYLFQCAYGACVDAKADCNGIKDCADGSDESDELCDRIGTGTTTTTKKPVIGGTCILPAYPDHGGYTVAGVPYAAPGQAFNVVYLNVTCNGDYGVDGKASLYCIDGMWSGEMPNCVRFCRLNPHPSVDYRCLITGGNSIEGSRQCDRYEPTGTVVRPECNKPNYYASGALPFMRCVDGSWDYVALCSAECGRITPDGKILIIDGRKAERGELPWHAGIYRKTTTPYMQICGGSLVSTTVVISAAHCFWSDVKRLLPASNYAVALGKLYRPYNNDHDPDAQKSDVSEIRVPVRFQGSAANFQDDIALLIVAKPFVYQPYIRPVCVDFETNFDRKQLDPGNIGKVAGWGLTEENGLPSQVLKVVELPYVRIEECITQSPPGFREYITSDKICAGYNNGTALCKGDSGGGLAFPDSDKGVLRYYLRGIVSTAPNNDNLCNAHTLTTFTQISKHEHFIKEYLQLY